MEVGFELQVASGPGGGEVGCLGAEFQRGTPGRPVFDIGSDAGLLPRLQVEVGAAVEGASLGIVAAALGPAEGVAVVEVGIGCVAAAHPQVDVGPRVGGRPTR